jgi:hypothetical protein
MPKGCYDVVIRLLHDDSKRPRSVRDPWRLESVPMPGMEGLCRSMRKLPMLTWMPIPPPWVGLPNDDAVNEVYAGDGQLGLG